MKKIIRVLLNVFGTCRSLFCTSQYQIKKGYFHRNHANTFNDIKNREEWQKEVYQYAEYVASHTLSTTIIDVGCGSAFKLLKYFGNKYNTIGLELTDTYKYLITQYPNKKWYNSESVNFASLQADLVICADVIEHVYDPTEFLNNLKQITGVKYFIFSTPDRLLQGDNYGPPNNKCHVREWTGNEFRLYLISQNFKILTHQISNYAQATQLIICSSNYNK